MKDIIVAFLVAFVLFRALRVFIFKNVNDAINEQNRNRQQPNEPLKPEGTITIQKTNQSKKKSYNDDEGEYVDYKEVK